MSLPTEINVIRAVTYDVDKVVSEITEAYDKEAKDVSLDEVMEWVKEWVSEDFGLEPQSLGVLSYLDENGQEL